MDAEEILQIIKERIEYYESLLEEYYGTTNIDYLLSSDEVDRYDVTLLGALSELYDLEDEIIAKIREEKIIKEVKGNEE